MSLHRKWFLSKAEELNVAPHLLLAQCVSPAEICLAVQHRPGLVPFLPSPVFGIVQNYRVGVCFVAVTANEVCRRFPDYLCAAAAPVVLRQLFNAVRMGG